MGKGEKPEKRGIRLPQNRRLINRKGKSYFLGIGINEYQNFRRLFNAVADVEEIAKVLFEEFEFETPVLLTNQEATKKAIINKLAHYYNNLKAGDKLLIYFSGHGLTDGPDPQHPTVFWAPVDADHNDHDSIINGDLVKFYFKRSQAQHIFLISDSCFAGGFLEGRSTPDKKKMDEDWGIKIEEKKSRWALFSGRDTEIVSDGVPGQHSPFARSILDFLQSEEKSTCINVGYFVDQVSKFANGYTGKQTAFGEPIPECGHTRSGQYVFWRRKIKKEWRSTSTINKSKNPSNISLPKYPVDSSELPPIPLITLKILIVMEESLRKSCQLMLKQLNIPVNQNTWVLRSVCESKIHALVNLLKGMDTFQKMFVKHSLASSKLYHSLKKIRQDYLDHFEESELEFMRSVGSSDFIAVIQTPSSNIGFQLSACEKVLKEVVEENGNDRNDLDYRLTEIKVALKLLYLLFENIHQATDLYDIPPHLSN